MASYHWTSEPSHHGSCESRIIYKSRIASNQDAIERFCGRGLELGLKEGKGRGTVPHKLAGKKAQAHADLRSLLLQSVSIWQKLEVPIVTGDKASIHVVRRP